MSIHKPSIGKDFVRGSQIFMHTFRMFVQSWKTLTFVSTLLFVSVSIGAWFVITNPDQRLILTKSIHAKALMSSDLFFADKTVYFDNPRGGRASINASVLLADPRTKDVLQKCFRHFGYSVAIGLLFGFGSVFLITFLFYRRGSSSRDKQVLRGPSIVTPKALKGEMKRKNMASKISLANVPMVQGCETENTVIVGAKGKGKTTCILELLRQVRGNNQKAIIYDKKGTFVEHFYRPGFDVILNPLDTRSEPWNLWSECKQSADYENIAESLMPMHLANSDPFWIYSARTIFSAASQQLKQQGRCRMQDLLEPIFTEPDSAKGLSEILKKTVAESLVSEEIERTALCIKATLSTYCKSLMYLRGQDEEPENTFSIRRWIENDADKRWVFVSVADENNISTIRPLITVWLDIAARAIISNKKDLQRRFWVIFDEFATAQRLSSIENLFREGREYGACNVIGFQDILQLYPEYGKDRANALLSLCNNQVLFGANSIETRAWMSKQMGEQEIIEAREGLSYGANDMRDGVSLSQERRIESLVLPTEFGTMDKFHAYLKLPGNLPRTQVVFELNTHKESSEPEIVKREDVDLFSLESKLSSHEAALHIAIDNAADKIRRPDTTKEFKEWAVDNFGEENTEIMTTIHDKQHEGKLKAENSKVNPEAAQEASVIVEEETDVQDEEPPKPKVMNAQVAPPADDSPPSFDENGQAIREGNSSALTPKKKMQKKNVERQEQREEFIT